MAKKKKERQAPISFEEQLRLKAEALGLEAPKKVPVQEKPKKDWEAERQRLEREQKQRAGQAGPQTAKYEAKAPGRCSSGQGGYGSV